MVNAAIGGWMISGTMFYRTGFPFSIIDGGATGVTGGQQPRRNQLVWCHHPGAAASELHAAQLYQRAMPACVAACFSSADFATSTDFMGTVGRNAFRGPGFLGGDMAVKKNFAINERMTFQMGFEAYNWFNHANYGTPYPNTNAPFFGQVAFMQFTPTSPYGRSRLRPRTRESRKSQAS